MMMARCCRCPTSVPVGVFDNRHAPYKNYAYLRNDFLIVYWFIQPAKYCQPAKPADSIYRA